MRQEPVVADAGPLIALEQIDQLVLLRQLFGMISIPPIVAQEIAPTVARPDWVDVRPLSKPADPRVAVATLDPGEREAISLALELQPRWVILDDRPARRLAARIGLPVIGTLGILLAAKRAGYVTQVRPLVDALLTRGFFMGPDLYNSVLREAGEHD